MLNRIKASPIPLWVNLLLVVLIALMAVQVWWNYFDNQVLPPRPVRGSLS